ncbi:hypothetical protein BOTBODRAFT_101845, partial [Botryobasidium botryosum FD-172 SS1]
VQKHREEYEARLAAWKERQNASLQPATIPVPDFESLHAAEVARAEARISRVKAAGLTVPASPGLTTARRAKERAQFDEKLREKELLVIRLKEIRKVEEERQEREEVRELRKQLDQRVKANPIPEWYKSAKAQAVDEVDAEE